MRLRQAVGNLLANALQYTPRGGSVSLSAHRGGDAVTLQVIDTGTGIASDDLPRVFDRFWRAEKSRSRRTGGSGLGLSVVRKLTEAWRNGQGREHARCADRVHHRGADG